MTIRCGMSVRELVLYDGLSVEQAQHEMNERVFGVGYTTDKHGVPVERGIGSKYQESIQHQQATAKARERQLLIDGQAARLAEAAARTGR
jgi:hypothetical protein